jgi:hypothetical protein
VELLVALLSGQAGRPRHALLQPTLMVRASAAGPDLSANGVSGAQASLDPARREEDSLPT